LAAPVKDILSEQDPSNNWEYRGLNDYEEEAIRQANILLVGSLSFRKNDPRGIEFGELGLELLDLDNSEFEIVEGSELFINGKANPKCVTSIRIHACSEANVKLKKNTNYGRIWEDADSKEEAVITKLREMISLDDLPLSWKYVASPDIYLEYKEVFMVKRWWQKSGKELGKGISKISIERPENKTNFSE
jgi:hypothetical protein